MSTKYLTGNPLGSTDVRDLLDNAIGLDDALNDVVNDTWTDRYLRARKTLHGYETEFETDQAARVQAFIAAQDARTAAFDTFLDGSGWSTLGVYGAGISITSHTQTVEYEGQPYQLKPSVPASIESPYVTTGDWATEGDNFKLVGDNSLRQDLAAPLGGQNIGGVTISVDSVAALLNAQPRADQRYATKSYHPGWAPLNARPRGGDEFVYDPNMPKIYHTGGDVVSVTSVWDGSPATFVNFIKNVGDTDPTGNGCFISVNSASNLLIDRFGATPHDASFTAQNYAAIRAAVGSALTHYIPRLDGQRSVELGVGEYFVTGQSPLMLNRSEMLALPGAYRYRRGFMVKGAGRNASILTMVTGGTQELYFYSTKDAAFPGDTSVADNVTWQDFTCRGLPDRRASLPDSQKISGLYMESYGWEKYLSVRNVDFEGIDRLAVYAGYGNVDHNWWYNCSFRVIRERMVYFNNNQSVANGFVGCHAEGLRDSLFSVGPEGGGDVSWIGGSLIQEPKVDVFDVPLPDQPPCGLVTWDNSSVTEGRSTGLGNNKFTFQGVRVECYAPNQAHVFTYRAGETAYGYLEVVFKDSSFVNPSIYNDTSVLPTAPYVGCYLENTTSVIYERCDIKYPYTFTIGDNNSEIVFEGGTYVPPPTASPTDGLAAVCTVGSVGGSIIARNVKMNQLINEGDYSRTRVADFTKGITGRTKAFTAVQGKYPLAPWPQPGQSANLMIYIPSGSIVKSVTIDKPADGATTGASNYELKILGSGGGELGATGGGTPSRALTSIMNFTYKVPPSPNNYIQVSSVGDGASAPFTLKSGGIIVEYL